MISRAMRKNFHLNSFKRSEIKCTTTTWIKMAQGSIQQNRDFRGDSQLKPLPVGTVHDRGASAWTREGAKSVFFKFTTQYSCCLLLRIVGDELRLPDELQKI